MNPDEARETVKAFAEDRPEAFALAKAVSLAAVIEVELVRAARLELFPDADAGAEADLWFSPLALSQTLTAMEFEPEVIEPLREELARDPDLLRRAWGLLERFHAGAPRAQRLEEELTWLALSGERNDEVIERRLQSVVAALRGGKRVGLARWASRALPSLPERARETEAARRLSVVAGVQTGVGPTLAAVPRRGVAEDILREITAKDIKPVKVGVRLLKKEDAPGAQSSGGTSGAQASGSAPSEAPPDPTPMLVEFSQPPAPSSEVIEVPNTYRLLLEVSWQDEDGTRRLRQLSLLPNETRPVEVGYGEVRIRTALGDTLTLRPRFDYDLLLVYNRAVKEWVEKLIERFDKQPTRAGVKRPKVAAQSLNRRRPSNAPVSEGLKTRFGSSRKVGFVVSDSFESDLNVLRVLEPSRPEPRGRRDWLIPIKVAGIDPNISGSDAVVDFGPGARFEDGFRSLWMSVTGENLPAPEPPRETESARPAGPLNVYISYAHKDEKLRAQLETHLESLRREGLIRSWSDRGIRVGAEWAGEIDEHLKSADIILLLVSPDFIASHYVYDVELKRAMERHEAGEAVVIPVILRPCMWQETPFGELQALPKDGRPVTTWKSRDQAFADVVKGVRRAVEGLASRVAPPTSPVSEVPRPFTQPQNLPRPPAVGFIARRDEQGRDIVRRLTEELAPGKNQVVALWGPGGAGKTTLAAEVARATGDVFGGRVAWVGALDHADFTLSTLLDDIGTQLGREDLRRLAPDVKAAQVAALVGSAPTLVVLDGFEAVAEEEQVRCLDFLARSAACPALITTRASLKRDDVSNVPLSAVIEREDVANVRLGVMSVEEARDFLERLAKVTGTPSHFRKLDRDDLIRRCEANPQVMQWAVRLIDLAKRPQDVMDYLARGEGDAAERVFGRSFYLPDLGEDGRAALLALSLFTPDASREALAEAAGFGSSTRRLDAAAERLSALWPVETAGDVERLALRGLTRELARARLSRDERADEFRRRYVEYFLHHAESHARPTPEDFHALEPEKENILGAMRVAFGIGDWKSAVGIRRAVDEFLISRGHWDEAIRSGKQAATEARYAGHRDDAAHLTTGVAMVHERRGEYEGAAKAYREALEIFGSLEDLGNIAVVLQQLGAVTQQQGNLGETRQLYEQSLEISRKIENQRGVALAMRRLGRLAQEQGNAEEARRFYAESLEISKTHGDLSEEAAGLRGLGALEEESSNFEEAGRLYRQSLEISERIGDQYSIAASLQDLGRLAGKRGEPDEGQRLLSRSLAIHNQLGRQQGVAGALHELGLLASRQGDASEAERLMHESLSIFERLRSPRARAVRQSLASLSAGGGLYNA